MPPFDPIASTTIRVADNLEPAFVHADQAEAAKRKLADIALAARSGPTS